MALMRYNDRSDAFHLGRDNRAFELLGLLRDGKDALVRVWFPDAESVYLCGDLNGWSRDALPLLPSDDVGCWEIRLPGASLKPGERYKLAVTRDGESFLVSDPYSVLLEGGGGRASVIPNDAFVCYDGGAWTERREKLFSAGADQPLNIYVPTVDVLAALRETSDSDRAVDRLAANIKRMGYTHIALGIPSIGTRLGSCEEDIALRRLVGRMHVCGVGVIADIRGITASNDIFGFLDIVPPYETVTSDGRAVPDIRRGEVRSYILSRLTLSIERYHVDGLILGSFGELFGSDGAGVFSDAIARLERAFWDTVGVQYPSLTVLSERTVDIPRDITGSMCRVYTCGGTYFSEMLGYLKTDPLFRKYSHGSFRRLAEEALREPIALCPSIGLGACGGEPLLEGIFGTYSDKLRQLRTFLMYVMSHPGKKLTSLGETADKMWLLCSAGDGGADMNAHGGLGGFLSELNAFYLGHAAFWNDGDDGFEWVLADEAEEDLVAYERRDASGGRVLCVFNFSGRAIMGYRLPFPHDIPYAETRDDARRVHLLWRTAFSSEGVDTSVGDVRVVGGGASITLMPFGAAYLVPVSGDGSL